MPGGALDASGSWLLLASGCLLSVHDAFPLREGDTGLELADSRFSPTTTTVWPCAISVLASQSICVLTYVCVHVLWSLVVCELRTG